jgi:hypothetical protein
LGDFKRTTEQSATVDTDLKVLKMILHPSDFNVMERRVGRFRSMKTEF